MKINFYRENKIFQVNIKENSNDLNILRNSFFLLFSPLPSHHNSYPFTNHRKRDIQAKIPKSIHVKNNKKTEKTNSLLNIYFTILRGRIPASNWRKSCRCKDLLFLWARHWFSERPRKSVVTYEKREEEKTKTGEEEEGFLGKREIWAAASVVN